jgi:hypothetical protein
MNLSRRRMTLGLGAASACAAGLLTWHKAYARPRIEQVEPQPINILCQALPAFDKAQPQQRQFGKLIMRRGFALRAPHPAFGGFSGLWRSSQGGKEFLALSDQGYWLKARAQTQEGMLSGFTEALIAPMLSASGKPLTLSRSYDTEGLTLHNGIAYVCVERTHEVLAFDWAKEGVNAKARSVPLLSEIKRLPSNKSLEAIGISPLNSALKGSLVVIAERSSGVNDEANLPTKGWIVSGPLKGSFQVARSKGFDVTDLVFLPHGDMLILERHYSLLRGVAMRLRRIALDDIRPQSTLEGEVIFEADNRYNIDNMEGLSVHLDEQGRTLLTLISDDNFSVFQSTLVWECELIR